VAQLPWVLLVAGVVFLGWGGWLFANAPTVRAK
jgi:hypothetical protein